MRKKKAAESRTPVSTQNTYVPKPDKSYAQFRKELKKAGYNDVFEQDNMLYVHADTEAILEETSSKIRKIAESIGYPHSFGVTMRKPPTVIKSVGNTDLDDSED